VGTGMHGGVIYIRGKVANVGKEVKTEELGERDFSLLKQITNEFCDHFELDARTVLRGEFMKLVPQSSRPYGALYNKH
jgi:glutamate synthase domain-containing protein 3